MSRQSTAMTVKPIDEMKTKVLAAQPTWSALLPAHMQSQPDKVFRCLVAAMQATPTLAECTPKSVIMALAHACGLGILPNSPHQHGWILPFRKKGQDRPEAQFQIGYRGLAMLAVNSGHVAFVQGRIVCENDHLEIHEGTRDELIHKRNILRTRGKIVGAYAVATMHNGQKMYRIMDIEEIEEHKRRSQSATSEYSPWHTDYAEMARKTPIRALCKDLPLSDEKSAPLYSAISHDERMDRGEPSVPAGMEAFNDMMTDDVEPQSPKSRAESLADKVGP